MLWSGQSDHRCVVEMHQLVKSNFRVLVGKLFADVDSVLPSLSPSWNDDMAVSMIQGDTRGEHYQGIAGSTCTASPFGGNEIVAVDQDLP